MASMFRKPKRNFRKKAVELDENDLIEDADPSNQESISITAPKPKKDKVKEEKKNKDSTRSKTVLSFEMEAEDDEEGSTEVFKIKKSSHSRRIAKQMKKERKDRERSGKDVTESDDEVDRKDREFSSRKQKKTEEDSARAEDNLRKLRDELRTLNGDEAEAAEDSDDDEQKAFKKMLARGEIPDAKTIHFIRKQRQKVRDGDAFIPLDEPEEKKTKTSTDRLVRDDDNDRSEDEDDDRVDFTLNNAARERQQMRDKFLAVEHGSDSDSDQEREWEKQQIRKATSLQIPGLEVPTTLSHENGSSVAFYSSSDPTANGALATSEHLKPLSALSKAQNASEITVESVRKRLEERLNVMDSVVRTHKLELDRIVSDSVDAKDSIENCQKSGPKLEAKFQFFQELRGYVRDLVECLNEKVPKLNELERNMEEQLKTRSTRLVQRRQQDIKDQCREFMTNRSNVKIDAEAGGEQVRQKRATEREARRARRRRAREDRNTHHDHHDGWSSDDDESDLSVMRKVKAEMESIAASRDCIFNDVVEDFSQIECVTTHFESWKSSHPDTYREAYIGLCIPKLLNPFVRIQLLTWNPFEVNCPDFEDMQWFSSLLFMGSKDGEMLEVGDDDLKILPQIVEKILLPKMTFIAQHVWDPISTAQTVRLVTLTLKLTQDYPTVHAKSKNFRAYLEAVVSRLNKTLEGDVFMPMYSLAALDNRGSGPACFFHRQSWTCIKLLGNILSWNKTRPLISTPTLQRLALSSLLNRYIVIGLASSPITREALAKVKAIISTLPKDWYSQLDGDSTLPQLENLCRYLVSAAKTLHTATALKGDSERREGREMITQMTKHLVTIHAIDHARVLSDEYSIRIQQC